MAVKLAPSSSGPIVASLDAVAADRISELELGISAAFDPERCPLELLPWLAFHYGVDVWSSAWSEDQKRAAVRDAIHNFRSRGSLQGLLAALGNFVSEVEVIEWFSEAGTPGTFRVIVTGSSSATSAEAQAAIAEIVARTVPYTRHYTIEVGTSIETPFIVAPATRISKILTLTSKNPAIWPA